MADEVIIFDAAGSMPDGSDPGAPTNSPLSIGPGTSYPLTEASFPAPPLNVQYASSVDTEGELPVSRRHGNRTIPLKIEMDESGANNTLLDALQAKFAKLQREGGTIKRTRKDGSTIRIYDIVAADGWDPVYDFKYLLGNSSEVSMTLPAKPYARGAEQDLGDNVETTLTSLVFIEASVPGDVDGPGRLVIDNDGTIPWWGVFWGIQSKYYDSATSAALSYQAEGRTAMSGSTIVAGPAGASGSGSNVMRNTSLLTSYQAVLSTQATAAGAHLSHVGTFKMVARVQVPATNTGTVSVALEWAQGDFGRFQQNTSVTIDPSLEGSWVLLDLGLVSPRKVISGTQRWEGRILAKSTIAGDDIDIDEFELIPADEGSGRAEAVATLPAPTSITGRDEFTGIVAASALNARVAPAGGTWATSGAAGDFLGNAGFPTDGIPDTVRRVSVGVRFGILGSTNYTNIAVSAWANTSFYTNNSEYVGVVARWVDASNYLAFRSMLSTAIVEIVIAGVATTLGTITPAAESGPIYEHVLAVTAAGDFTALLYDATNGSVLAGQLNGSHSALATGGTLATGKPGIVDNGNAAGGGPNTHDYDNVRFWVPPSDAGVFAGQSLQVRHDGVYREDSGGTIWQPVSSYEGDHLRVPPAGAEARTDRFIVRPIYHPPSSTGVYLDDRIDDLSARVFVTPRYL